jgi:hypothetical protein
VVVPRCVHPRRARDGPVGVTDGEPEDLAPPISADSGGDHDRLGHDAVVDPGLAIGGIEEHVREGLLGQATVAKRAHLGVQVGADPAHLALGDGWSMVGRASSW